VGEDPVDFVIDMVRLGLDECEAEQRFIACEKDDAAMDGATGSVPFPRVPTLGLSIVASGAAANDPPAAAPTFSPAASRCRPPTHARAADQESVTCAPRERRADQQSTPEEPAVAGIAEGSGADGEGAANRSPIRSKPPHWPSRVNGGGDAA
jgi:hypothetical protein